ncbi:MAG: hypothetical protein DMG22_13125 [Acidobacteria bacterium]|nr:MAG: hypothetical protein DMG22_13125 [Acidobacteriota bacterium]
MKFVITWTCLPGQYKPAISRFLETGAPPPTGVKMLGRYHGLEGSSSGFIVAETGEAKAIYAWLAPWMENVSFTVTPVVEDAEAAQLLQNARSAKA